MKNEQNTEQAKDKEIDVTEYINHPRKNRNCIDIKAMSQKENAFAELPEDWM